MASGLEPANDGSAASVMPAFTTRVGAAASALAMIDTKQSENLAFSRRRKPPPNTGLLRTKDRLQNFEFSPYAGPQGPW
jgi:hypothetical protein